MNKRPHIILLLIFISYSSFSQSEKLNQLDSTGKKDGKWIMYLDYNWKIAKDSSKAVYWRYTYFIHGKDRYNMGARGLKGYKYEPASDTSGRKRKIIMLNGEYKSYDKNGKLKFVNLLDKGEYVYYKEYDKAGNLSTYIDYTKQFLNEPHSFYIYVYKKNGGVTTLCVHNGQWGWMGYGYSGADSAQTEILKIKGDSTFLTLRFYEKGKVIGQYGEIHVKGSDGKEVTIKHGHTISYYSNGQKREEGEYYYGKKIGEWKHWGEHDNSIPDKDVHSP